MGNWLPLLVWGLGQSHEGDSDSDSDLGFVPERSSSTVGRRSPTSYLSDGPPSSDHVDLGSLDGRDCGPDAAVFRNQRALRSLVRDRGRIYLNTRGRTGPRSR